MSEDIKPDNGKPKEPLPTEEKKPETDFKIAEIWIRDGQLMLDASNEFWSDRIRAMGILEYCKEIVKTAKGPQENKPKIITGSGFGPMDYIRNRINKFRGKK